MKMRSFILALIVLGLSVVTFGQSKNRNDAPLKSLIKQMAEAQIAFDAKALGAVFTSDYIEISLLGEVDPRANVLGFYAPEMKPPGGLAAKADLTEFSIRDYGKFAVVIVKMTFAGTINGKEMPPRSLRGTFVCRHEKGSWKLASAQYTGIRPKQPQSAKTQ